MSAAVPSRDCDGSEATPSPAEAELAELGRSMLLFHLRPPYRGCDVHVGARALPPEALRDGSVVLLQPAAPAAPHPQLEALVARLQRQMPGACLALSLCEAVGSSGPGAPYAAERLPRGLRAVVGPGETASVALRRQLTSTRQLAEQVAGWLEMYGVALSPMTRLLVVETLRRAERHAQMYDLCRELGAGLDAAVSGFRAERLPHPGLWLEMARALHAAVRLQAEPERSLHWLCRESGLSAPSTLNMQLLRCFGCRSDEVRHTLGWEWLLCRWASRALRPQARSAA